MHFPCQRRLAPLSLLQRDTNGLRRSLSELRHDLLRISTDIFAPGVGNILPSEGNTQHSTQVYRRRTKAFLNVHVYFDRADDAADHAGSGSPCAARASRVTHGAPKHRRQLRRLQRVQPHIGLLVGSLELLLRNHSVA